MRTTEQRKIILEELMKRTDHPSADDIYGAVRERIPHISLGTVYRNLERLADGGEIVRLSGGAQMRFDGDRSFHIHFRCLLCGRIEDVPMEEESMNPADPNGALKGRPEQNWLRGRRITALNVEYLGYCPLCAAALGDKDES